MSVPAPPAASGEALVRGHIIVKFLLTTEQGVTRPAMGGSALELGTNSHLTLRSLLSLYATQ